MPTTKTAPKVLTAEEADAALVAARARLDGLREKVASGDFAVTAEELAEAEDARALAELQVAGHAEHRRRLAEEARLARIAEIRGDLNGGRVQAQVAAVVALYDAAVAAIGDLYRAKAALEVDLGAALSELRRLAMQGPMPAGVEPAPRNSSSLYATVDGVRFKSLARTNAVLVAEAALEAINAVGAGRSQDEQARATLRGIVGSYSTVAGLRALVPVPAEVAAS